MDLMEMIANKRKALNANKRAKTVKPTDGRSRWRILPGWRKDDPTFYHDFGQHFIKDGTGAMKAIYVCVDKTFGKPCDICSSIGHAIKTSSDDAMVELLKQANASARVLMNALHLDGPTPGEPQILEIAPTVFNEILGIIQEWGAEVLNLDDGKDIIIERTGKGIGTKYSVQIASKSVAVDASVMGRIANLDEYVAQESEEQAKRALANLNAVAGMLPAPGTSKPSLSDIDIDSDPTLTIPGEPLAAVKGEGLAPAIAPAAKAVKAEVPAPSVATGSTGDSELDDLLAELG